MGIFSKLFGGNKEAEKTATELFNSLFANAKDNKPAAEKPQTAQPQNTKPEQPKQPEYDPELSEWEQIPTEECQYNYGGDFEQYFEHVFTEDFPAYRTEKTYVNKPDCSKRVAYTFYSGPSKALVVELMPESSEAKKFREDTKRSGTPYLRFYYNHEGWWNKRSYVTARIKTVLG